MTTYRISTIACDASTVTVAAEFDDPRSPASPIRTTRIYEWSPDDGYGFDYGSEEHTLPDALSEALDAQASYGDRGMPTTVTL